MGGLTAAAVIYLLVSVVTIALVPAEQLAEGDTPLLKVVEAGAPGFPLSVFGVITMFAVGNSALINVLMASRLAYGMRRQRALPPAPGRGQRARRSTHGASALTPPVRCDLSPSVGQGP